MSAPTAASPRSVAIIGGGPAGLILALTLKQQGINATVFELRQADYKVGGAIGVAPNGLRILDQLGVFQRVRTKGCYFDVMTFKSDQGFQTTGTQLFGGGGKYGYQTVIISRYGLLVELRAAAQEQGIPVEMGRRFVGVVSEDENGVRFAFEDGSQEVADILVGADGMNSLVRQSIFPDIKPLYSGFIGGTFGVDWGRLRFPPGQEVPSPTALTIHGSKGAMMFAPRPFSHTNALVIRQVRYPEQDRDGWEALQQKRDELVGLLQSDMDDWSDVSRSALEQLSHPEIADLNLWPFCSMQKLDSWFSPIGRIIFLGDAAHAMLPSAAQGANQAIESAYTLAILLSSLSAPLDLPTTLKAWQEYRQGRLDKVLEIIERLNYLRLTDTEKSQLPPEKVAQFQNAHTDIAANFNFIYSADVKDDVVREVLKGNVGTE